MEENEYLCKLLEHLPESFAGPSPLLSPVYSVDTLAYWIVERRPNS
jgi:hypothetical protein